MITIESKQVTVYRSNLSRKGRQSKVAAYKDAAWRAWQAAYYPGCMCRREEPQEDFDDFFCPEHGDTREDSRFHTSSNMDRAYRRLVIDRLVRWLMWRDKVTIPRRLKSDIRRHTEWYHEERSVA